MIVNVRCVERWCARKDTGFLVYATYLDSRLRLLLEGANVVRCQRLTKVLWKRDRRTDIRGGHAFCCRCYYYYCCCCRCAAKWRNEIVLRRRRRQRTTTDNRRPTFKLPNVFNFPVELAAIPIPIYHLPNYPFR